VDDISNEQLLEVYMGGLQEDIKHFFFFKHLKNIYGSYAICSSYSSQDKATHKYTNGAYTESKDRFGAHKTTLPQSTRLTPQQIDERRAKGLCFNFDKYNKGNKCNEKKVLYIDNDEEVDQELELLSPTFRDN
jgi:hypothetical protein